MVGVAGSNSKRAGDYYHLSKHKKKGLARLKEALALARYNVYFLIGAFVSSTHVV